MGVSFLAVVLRGFHETGVDGDAVEPGGEAGGGFESGRDLNAEMKASCSILAIGVAAEEAAGDGHHLRAEGGDVRW